MSLATRLLSTVVAAGLLLPGGVALAPTATAATSVGHPGKPVIGSASSGKAGGAATATARWSAPRSTGGSPVTHYLVRFTRYNGKLAVAGGVSPLLSAKSRSHVFRLDKGTYRFDVIAINAKGESGWSAKSALVTAR